MATIWPRKSGCYSLRCYSFGLFTLALNEAFGKQMPEAYFIPFAVRISSKGSRDRCDLEAQDIDCLIEITNSSRFCRFPYAASLHEE